MFFFGDAIMNIYIIIAQELFISLVEVHLKTVPI